MFLPTGFIKSELIFDFRESEAVERVDPDEYPEIVDELMKNWTVFNCNTIKMFTAHI